MKKVNSILNSINKSLEKMIGKLHKKWVNFSHSITLFSLYQNCFIGAEMAVQYVIYEKKILMISSFVIIEQ